ncbi:YdeI/OmpD-associated family protein [Cohnella silvisoli]|uniref:YdeI/OmpD-associated family protein n=1 Tax=Cohnella silvisoli TaxID=2873699 RepID=A0ABV1KX10_9BACL|nr:YdeI/OmpD-associated family protein [Cohnella silvisoli]MCD9023580.1 YdeI/OmpD-associated family protein [Cohnella silvisoli]
MKFRAVIELGGKTATGIQVPEEVIASLGASKRPPVLVTIGGYSYRSTVAPMGGRFMIPLSAEHRAGSGVAAGDEVDVDIELDTEPREIAVPSDFSEVLERNADAKMFFDGLSYSNKKRFVISIEEAKTAETREKRIAKAISMLNEGQV